MRKMRSRGGSPGRTTEVHTMKKWQIIVLVLAVAALAAGIGAYGESVQCSAGAQLLFRSGSAAATGELADLTTGESLAAGSALTANHLYLAAEGCEIIASSASSLMLR